MMRRTPQTAIAILAFVAIATGFTGTPAEGAWQVAAGSVGNELELELHNLGQAVMSGPLTVSVVDAPAWMSAIAITPALNAALDPGEAATAMVRFDVAPGASTGTRGTVLVSITAAGGDSWRQPVSLEVAEHPDEIQTDCCSAIEISTTGVGGSDLAGASGAGWGDVSIENVPNPSNPATSIRFTLAARGNVNVSIHDVSGRLVRALVAGARDAGRQEVAWDGRMEHGESAPSGIYFVRVTAGGMTHSAKLVLTR